MCILPLFQVKRKQRCLLQLKCQPYSLGFQGVQGMCPGYRLGNCVGSYRAAVGEGESLKGRSGIVPHFHAEHAAFGIYIYQMHIPGASTL